jgi:hypothetical protein
LPRPSYIPAHSLEPGPAPASRQLTLLDILDRILDKGVVINGDITLSFASIDLLSLKINLVIASLETAKRYGIELPWEKWEREKKEIRERSERKELPSGDINAKDAKGGEA